MRHAYDGGGIQGGVDGAETEDLGFGAAGGGATEAGLQLAQGGIAVLPEVAGGGIATEENFRSGGGPVERASEVAGDGKQIGGREASSFGETVAAMHPGPETPVGESVVRFGAGQVLGELTMGDVGYEAGVGWGGVGAR